MYRVVLAGNQVISFQCLTKFVGLNTDDGIGSLTEVLVPAENLSGNRLTLDLVPSSGNGFQNHKLKKFPLLFSSLEF